MNPRPIFAVLITDLPKEVVYRVQPQGSIETKRGTDTVLELVNRENEEVKVWAPSSVVDALYSGPNVKKIPYIRSLGVRGKRKVLETVFLQDNQPWKKKSKEEQPKAKDSEFFMKLSKITKKIPEEEEKKKPPLERQSTSSKEAVDEPTAKTM